MRIVMRQRWEGPIGGAGTSMNGDLQQVTLPSLVAFTEAERRSGLITIHTSTQQARIGVRDGVVTSVHIPDPGAPASLPERLLIVLDWRDGRFVMDATHVVEGGESVRVQMALMEHARRKDEANRS